MLRIAYSAIALTLALTFAAPASAATSAHKKAAPAKAAAPAEPAKPLAHVVEYTELEHHVGDTIVVETTLDTVRRGKLVKYTNPGLTLQLGPENGSIELDIPRETVRNVSVVAAESAAPAKDDQEAGSAKRTDLKSVLIIGAGPIVIGQACEFDYSGAQACKALKEEGYRVVLVNSNPATIMTDPGTADAVYIEPINWQTVERIIAKEKPDALLPTMGGQTALNCALDLADHGVLEKYGVELIGASREAIRMAEDRELFRVAMKEIGLECPKAEVAKTFEQAVEAQAKVGYPTIIRPSFTLGGSGGGIAYNREEFEEIVKRGLDSRPCTKSSSRNPCSAGRNSRWKSSATPRTTASSCAASRTSTRWACTPATRSPWRRRRRSPTRNTSACAMRRSPCCARSASTPAARTCSSASMPRTAASSSSR
jgi:carbamoyl-phosphate synthase large subunit